jgi:hypothetical protein
MKNYWLRFKSLGTNNMNKENFFDTKQLIHWAKIIWSLAFWPLTAFALGLFIGAGNSESRIMSDCKYAQTFRVDHQAFACQRKI